MTFKQPRFNPRSDENQKQIVEALRAAGASVLLLRRCAKGVPDLLVGYRGQNILIEVKRPGQKLKPDQQKWAADWLGQMVFVAKSVDDGLHILRAVSRNK